MPTQQPSEQTGSWTSDIARKLKKIIDWIEENLNYASIYLEELVFDSFLWTDWTRIVTIVTKKNHVCKLRQSANYESYLG